MGSQAKVMDQRQSCPLAQAVFVPLPRTLRWTGKGERCRGNHSWPFWSNSEPRQGGSSVALHDELVLNLAW